MAQARIALSELAHIKINTLYEEHKFACMARDSAEESLHPVSKDFADYIHLLEEEIKTRPDRLKQLADTLTENYLQKYTSCTPSERLPIGVSDSVGSWIDWGISYIGLGLFKTNQKYAVRAKNIAEMAASECDVEYRKSPLFDRTKRIQIALGELEKIYQEMYKANIKKGEVISMLEETFRDYFLESNNHLNKSKKMFLT